MDFLILLFVDNIAAMNQVEEADIHALTGVLKLYFREFPEHVFTATQYKSFINLLQFSPLQIL